MPDSLDAITRDLERTAGTLDNLMHDYKPGTEAKPSCLLTDIEMYIGYAAKRILAARKLAPNFFHHPAQWAGSFRGLCKVNQGDAASLWHYWEWTIRPRLRAAHPEMMLAGDGLQLTPPSRARKLTAKESREVKQRDKKNGTITLEKKPVYLWTEEFQWLDWARKVSADTAACCRAAAGMLRECGDVKPDVTAGRANAGHGALEIMDGGFKYAGFFTALSGQALDVLREFVNAPDHTCNINHLHESVWNGRFVTDENVRTYARYVRRALRQALEKAEINEQENPLPVVDRGRRGQKSRVAWRMNMPQTA